MKKNINFKDKMILDLVDRYMEEPNNLVYPVHFFKEEHLNWNDNLVDKNGKAIPTVTDNYMQFVLGYQRLIAEIQTGRDVSDQDKLNLVCNSHFIAHDLKLFPFYDEEANIENDLNTWQNLFEKVLNADSVDSSLLTLDKLKQMNQFAERGYWTLKNYTSHYRPNTLIIDLPLAGVEGGHYCCTPEDYSWDSQEILSDRDLEKMADQPYFTLSDLVTSFSIIWNSTLIAEDENYIAFNSGDLLCKYIYNKNTNYYAQINSPDYEIKAVLEGLAKKLDFELTIEELE
ncbi:hypothetical protein [Lactobacillus crispatus]|uniref:hypothetical protein n=1 Tax=Lactobacillus crispatus TaxID=47770 RepID=UPI00105EB912|nr:hypothetical protein [Lactobacillus crispatus]TDN01527.1 hypothetical protein CEE85_12000 [Lactobacillus crispatus]